MSQWLRACLASAEDTSSIPITQCPVLTTALTPVPGDLMSLGVRGHQHAHTPTRRPILEN